MRIAKIILVLLTVGALALVPTVATAQPFTFNVTSGDWETPTNWNPPTGPPAAGDVATIPSGKTCRIETADQAVFDLLVIGELIIKGKTLSMLENGFSSPLLNVEGAVKFEKPGATTPKIVFTNRGGPGGPFRIISTNNAGKIVAFGAAGHEGVIESAPVDALKVERGVLIRGSIAVEASILTNDGRFLVDAAADTMFIGATNSGFGTSGSGTFEVTAGDMFIRRLKPAEFFDGTLKVSGGTMTLTEHVAIFQVSEANVRVSGGTLLFESDWRSLGGLNFTGGTIKVVANETATFE